MAIREPSTPWRFPPDPVAACVLAEMYRSLGGFFSIAGDGRRYFGRPEPTAHEEGMKLVEKMLSRREQADSDMIYGLFAAVVDDRKLKPSIEEPRRPQ